MAEVFTTKPVTVLTIELKSMTLMYREGEEWPWWIQKSNGEGMSLSDADLEEALRRHFVEHF